MIKIPMEIPLTEIQNGSLELRSSEVEDLLKRAKSDAIAIIAIVGPPSGGKFMIASSVRAYLEEVRLDAELKVLKDEDIFNYNSTRNETDGYILALFRPVHLKQMAVYFIVTQIPRDMPDENADKLLLWTAMLSSKQIFNIPNQISEADKLRIQTITKYNLETGTEHMDQAMFLRDVLVKDYRMSEERLGEQTIECYRLPSPGGEIFRTVPAAAEEFRTTLLDHLKKILMTDRLSAKKISRQLVSGSELLVYVKELDPANIPKSMKKAREIINGVRGFRQQIFNEVPFHQALRNVVENLPLEIKSRLEEYIEIERERLRRLNEEPVQSHVHVVAEHIQHLHINQKG